MAEKTAIQTLIELTEKTSDELAKRLGEHLKAAKAAEEKMAILGHYKEDYISKLEISMQRGITPAAYNNFSLFIGKLDAAIKVQKIEVESKSTATEKTKKAWQDSEKKRMSYATLSTRATAQALKKEIKRDQKASDEQASRITQSRKSGW